MFVFDVLKNTDKYERGCVNTKYLFSIYHHKLSNTIWSVKVWNTIYVYLGVPIKNTIYLNQSVWNNYLILTFSTRLSSKRHSKQVDSIYNILFLFANFCFILKYPKYIYIHIYIFQLSIIFINTILYV